MGGPDAWPWAVFGSCLIALAAAWWNTPPFSPDSWSYYELSVSLWSDGYTLKHLRVFGGAAKAGPATSFPPHWPLVWSIFAMLTGLQVRAGYVLTFVLTFAFAALSELIGRRLFEIRFVGLFAATFICLTPGYFSEIVSARSIPLQLVISAMILLVLLEKPAVSGRGGAILGLLSGAAVLTRFDMLPFAFGLGVGVAALSRSAAVVGSFVTAMLISLSPWIATSLVWHNSVFASDNSGIAFSADRMAFVTDWHSPGNERRHILNHPLEWLRKVSANTVNLLRALKDSPGPWGKYLLLAITAVAAMQPKAIWLASSRLMGSAEARQKLVALTCFAAAVLLMLPLYIVVGYFDDRYFSLSLWLAVLSFASVTAAGWKLKVGLATVERVILAFGGVTLAILVGTEVPSGLDRERAAFPLVSEHAAMVSCISRTTPGSSSRLLVTEATLAARLSAVHGMKTSFLPRNFTYGSPREADLRIFLSTYDIAYLGGDAIKIEKIFPLTLRERIAGDCGVALYRVSIHGN